MIQMFGESVSIVDHLNLVRYLLPLVLKQDLLFIYNFSVYHSLSIIVKLGAVKRL